MSEERLFGNNIGNTMTESSLEDRNNDHITIATKKSDTITANSDRESMEIKENESTTSVLSNALATEIFNLVNEFSSNLDDLLEEIEELLEDSFFPGETVYHNGKEHVIKSKERKGGLVLYLMVDGSKINHRDLTRNKELNMDYIKNLVEENADFDGNHWTVNEETKSLYQVKEKVKLASIFNTTPKAKKAREVQSSESSEDDEEVAVIFQGRASAGAPAKSNRKSLQVKQQKEAEKAKLKEKREKEKEEKKKQQMEEKKKIQDEKKKNQDEKKKKEKEENNKKNGNLDKFVKKGDTAEGNTTAAIFSGEQFSKKRYELGLKKLEEAWIQKNLEAFTEACQWCEKNLSTKQVDKISREEWKFGIQKLLDRAKDKLATKSMKPEQRTIYKQEMLEKRKEYYKKMEATMKLHFTEDAAEDLIIKSEKLELEGAVKIEGGVEMIRCLTITQFLVSSSRTIDANVDITAEKLFKSLNDGFEGFKNCSYKVLKTFIESILDEMEYWRVAELYVRVKEYPITEYTITDICRAIVRKDRTLQEKSEKKEEEYEEEEIGEQEEEDAENAQINEERRLGLLRFFNENQEMIWKWRIENQLDLLEYMMDTLMCLPIIRDSYQLNLTTEKMIAAKEETKKLQAKIAELKKELAEIPNFTGDLESLSRTKSKEVTENARRKEQLGRQIDEYKAEIDELTAEFSSERALSMRKYRGHCIGQDRHFRRYYWFAYNADSGIWVQDIGTTSYEKWVKECVKKGIMDIEDNKKTPEYVPEPMKNVKETWWRYCDSESLEKLEKKLIKNGLRESGLKTYIQNNKKEISTCFWKRERSRSSTPIEEEQDEKPDFSGKFETLKTTIWTILTELAQNFFTKIKNVDDFVEKIQKADSIDEIRTLIIELTESIYEKVIIMKHPLKDVFKTKKFSHLMIPRFCNRLMAINRVSGLHMQLAYLHSRIDIKRSLHVKACNTCRKKTRTEDKLNCTECSETYHYDCAKPRITEEEFKAKEIIDTWTCYRCLKAEERRRLKELREEQLLQEEEEEETESEDEDDENMKPRRAKRKATEALKDWYADEPKVVVPPKPKKRPVLKEVAQVFESFEKLNPRLFKILQSIPSQRKSTRHGSSEGQDLGTIEENLSEYRNASSIRKHISSFLSMARIYMESHNSRKIEELETLISEFDT